MALSNVARLRNQRLTMLSADGVRREFLDLAKGCADDADIAAVFDYWTVLKGDRRAPARAELEPAAIPKQLPGILLYDVEHDPLRFRYRLIGTYSDKIHGGNLKGEYVDALTPRLFAQTLHNDFALLTEDWQPQLVALTFTNREGNYRNFTVVRMPLSSDGETVDNIIAYSTLRG